MDGGTINARRVLAGLGKLVFAFVVAFIDDDLVVDRTWDDDELGTWDAFRRELGILGRHVCVSPAPTVI